MDDAAHDLDLVMPFLVVQSAGGAYEDVAFAAGWHAAQVREALSHSGATWAGTIRTASLAQFDLIAMERGLFCDVTETGDEWSTVRIRPKEQPDV